jgi:DNA modification methylase
MKTETIKLSQIRTNDANPRQIKEAGFTKLVNSVLVFPRMLEIRPIVVDNLFITLSGNMRYRALSHIAGMSVEDITKRLNETRDYTKKTPAEKSNLIDYWQKWLDNPTAIIIKASELSADQQREFIIKDNVGFGEWDYDVLAGEWDAEDLDDWGLDVWQEEGEDGEDSKNSTGEETTLSERFVVPPFSILDTRKGYWRKRKKAWTAMIGDMGDSRNMIHMTAPEVRYPNLYERTSEHRKSLGIGFAEYLEKYVSKEERERADKTVLSHSVSLFDPVLSEIMCRWFTPFRGAKIFDPFAGDTRKGLVFGKLGFEFTGIELRQEQVDVNNKVIAEQNLSTVRYICDDGRNVAKHIEANSRDLLFSCPPYFDLEKYSDHPSDASNQRTYADFIAIVKSAFTDALASLKNNRFAIIIAGDIRNKKTGCYYNFIDDVKRIFIENGAELYNELILIESGASTAMRAGISMNNRKVTKMHQNVLVFYKGKTKEIAAIYPKIEFTREDEEIFNQEMGISEE